MNKITFPLMVMIVSIFLGIGCHSSHNHNEHEALNLPVTHALLKDTSILREYVCQIHSINHIDLRSQERGYLDNIYVDEGDVVQKGQLLFQVMPKLYQAEVSRAKAEAKVAEIEYLNTKALADSNVVSVNELAITQAKFEKAKAELALAEAHLGFTEIRAPFDGIIDRFHVRPGSLVEEGELLTTLSDNSKMWVYFNVPEAEYLDYKIATMKGDSAQKVKLLMANNKVFNQIGVIETIEADFNHETGNIPFRATFKNPNGLLRNGETGNILIEEEIKDAMIIPQKATYEVLEKRYVFVVHEDGKIEARQIEIGEELPHLFVITAGLKAKEMILLDGLRKVRHNDEIKYHQVSADSVISHLNLYAE